MGKAKLGLVLLATKEGFSNGFFALRLFLDQWRRLECHRSLVASVSFVTDSLSFSTNPAGGGNWSPKSYEIPLRVVIALASFLGFGMVLLGKELELEAIRQTQLVDTETESNLEEAPSEAEESHPLGSRVTLISENFKASEPLGTRTVSSYSPVSSDSTAPLSPDHPLTHVSPTPTPT
ncbi:hypothetical protein Tco_0404217 [Tanacetum coccineum]